MDTALKKTGFICPICSRPLACDIKHFECVANHRFDRAKSGYVNLLLSNSKNSKIPGDNKLMVDARRNFLEKDYYLPLAKTLCEQVAASLRDKKAVVLLDAGCGEGYYTNLVELELQKYNRHSVLGVDISKFALNCAAKCNHEVLYAVGSIFHLAVADKSIDAVLNLFAPFCAEEFTRVLKHDGLLFMVIPGKRHLWELKSALYDEPYENDIKSYELEGFTLCNSTRICDKITLTCNEDIENLFTMTPYYYKTSEENAARLKELNTLETTIEFELLVYQKNI